MLKARGKLISLLTACMSLVLMLVMGITTLSIQPKVASAADTTVTLQVFGTTGTLNGKSISWTNDIVTFTNNQGSSTTAIRTSDSDHYRVYAKSNGSISVAGEATITKVVITCTSSGYATACKNSFGNTASASGSVVTITPVAGATSVSFSNATAQWRLNKIVVTYNIADIGGEPTCEHTNTTTTTVDATCTEAGSETVTCDDCGETVSTKPIPATGHSYVDVEGSTVDATCTENGSKQVKCSVCNDEKEESISATGHNYVDGFCSVCGAKEPIIEEYTLTFDTTENRVSQDSNKQVWSQNGITFTNNKGSGSSIIDSSNPVRLYANSEIIVEAVNMSKIVFDCNSTDYATALKNSIGASATVSGDKVTVEFTELTHSFTVAKLSAQVRMDSITVTVISEKECEHEHQKTVEVPASCTKNGSITITCDDCDTLLSSVNIPALGHTETENGGVAATCTETGSKEWICDVCSETRTEVIPATGHTCVDGVCTECEEKQPLESTITFDNKVKRTEFSSEKQVWVEGWIKVTNNKASSTTAIADYASPVRFYKSSELIVECNDMIKIVFNCDTAAYASTLQSSIGNSATADGKVVTVVLEEAVNSFTVTLSGAVWIESIDVYKQGAKIDSASVTLGDDIALNYYVAMNGQIENVTMKITLNGEVCDQELPEPTDGRYKISFELPPQYMANEITVDLLVDDVVVDSNVYSVKMYAQDILNNSKSTDEVKRLVSDMLYYGAAAQKYKGYNVENLATDEVENLLAATDNAPDSTNFTLVKNSEISSYPAYFTGAGVHFADVNKIYVKLSTTENVTLKINGEDVAVNGTTVYTDGIKATEFGTTYTFELYCDGVLMQTLTYSVNAYAYAKQGESAMGELALALYRYGKSAKAYAGE